MGFRVEAPLRLSLLLSVPVWCAFVANATAACTTDAAQNVTCDGPVVANTNGPPPVTNGYPITIYDKAAGVQPAGGSNAYTPATYNRNPDPVFVTINAGAAFSPNPILVTAANRSTVLADGGLIAANFSNAENPAVNNVVVNNFGTIALSNAQSTNRVSILVADSQVNSFTVNNATGATLTINQTALGGAFNSALLQNTSSGTPVAYTPRYGAPNQTLAITSVMYSDDNTNSFVVNNAGTISATGHYATAYFGRAETTIKNSGTFGNSDWQKTDRIYDGHWALATFAGAEFATLDGSNPDTPIYDVRVVNGQNVVAIGETASTKIKNTGTINGDILVLDTNPLVTAVAAARNQALPLAVSAGNSGPRDSSIVNNGTINGNFYLGSGKHVIKNAEDGTIAGAINVDQRPSVGNFAANPVVGTTPKTYSSAGPTRSSSTGTACPTTGANTTDLYCAQSGTVAANFVGAQKFRLDNSGKLEGDITIIDQPTSVNKISLTGTGFTGNVIAMNGTGSNSLTLNDVTALTSVQRFSRLDLQRSNVTVSAGVSLVDNARIATTIYGTGGTFAAPSQKIGTIAGTLTLAGTTTIVPTFATLVRNGDVYQVASSVTGAGANAVGVANSSALVTTTADTSSGRLLLETSVRDPRTIPGLNQSSAATLGGLLSYNGSNAQVRALGALVENFGSLAAVRDAAAALTPIVNGADVQTPLNSTTLFNQQIDSRLDGFIYAQIPSSGRSADLGVPHPTPVYGALPASGAWIEGIGGGVHQSTVAGTNGYEAELEGVIGGYDRLIAQGLRVGGAFGYTASRVNGSANLGTRQEIQVYQGLAYATYDMQRLYVRGSAGYGGADFQSTRQIAFAGFNDVAIASHRGDVFTARGEAGAPFEYLTSLFVPYAAFTYNNLQQAAYAETSANGAALTFQSARNESERSEVGGKLVVPIGDIPVLLYLFPAGASALALEGRAAYVHEFGNVAQTVAASFAGGGNVFVAAGPVPDRDMLDYSVGLLMGSGPIQINLAYSGLARSSYLQQVGLLRARYVF